MYSMPYSKTFNTLHNNIHCSETPVEFEKTSTAILSRICSIWSSVHSKLFFIAPSRLGSFQFPLKIHHLFFFLKVLESFVSAFQCYLLSFFNSKITILLFYLKRCVTKSATRKAGLKNGKCYIESAFDTIICLTNKQLKQYEIHKS